MAALVQAQLNSLSGVELPTPPPIENKIKIDAPEDNSTNLFKSNDELISESDAQSHVVERSSEPMLEEVDEELSDDDLDMIESIDEASMDEPQEQNLEQSVSITEQILQEEQQRIAEEDAQKPDPIEEHIEKPVKSQKDEVLETRTVQTPIVPVYSSEIPDEDIVESDSISQGDVVTHDEFGRGVVEKIINYGGRDLCSINFEEVGRKLLDPKISEMKKV